MGGNKMHSSKILFEEILIDHCFHFLILYKVIFLQQMDEEYMNKIRKLYC